MQQVDDLAVDPEEVTEGKLINGMALAIVAVVAIGILLLTLRPWIQRMREERAGQVGEA
jgi:hypothetical protein